MKIKDIISNMGQHELETHFIGKVVLDTLRHYDEELLRPSQLRKLVCQKITEEEMIRTKSMRNALFNSIRSDADVEILSQVLKVENNRDALCHAQIRRNSQKEKNLFELFGTEYKVDDTQDLPDKVTVTGRKELFAYQRTAVDEILGYLMGSEHAALLHMPTGSGKTRTAMRAIANIFMICKPALVLWIALTEELCEQAIGEFKSTWESVGDRPVPILRFFGNHSYDTLKNHNLGGDGFVVASMSKLQNIDDEQFPTTLADHVKLVVMDEAHHAIAKKYKKTIGKIAKKHTSTMLLGLSATPGRTLHDTEENSQLAHFFGSNKATIRIDNQNPVRYLIDNGYISEPDIDFVEHKDHLSKDDHKIIAKQFDIPDTILAKLGNDVRRNMKIVALVEKFVSMGEKRIIVFTPDIASSRNISMILTARGMTSYYIDSHLSSELRKDIIGKYKAKSDKATILCNVRVLTAGFDAPETSVVIIARPTKSLVLYSQMMGRAIRGPKVGGTEKCFIRVITDASIVEFRNIAKAFTHWEEDWR